MIRRRPRCLAEASDGALLAELRRRIKSSADRDRERVQRGLLELHKAKMATQPIVVTAPVGATPGPYETDD